ncbi:unnamed protein product [Sphagnum troendelagicum]|uniref:Protein kinase domain-containing protein n=1 Tax=Sphagnum troendelagicum TaxID=128251 RepID=A0ABP0U9Y9_9BRYO
MGSDQGPVKGGPPPMTSQSPSTQVSGNSSSSVSVGLIVGITAGVAVGILLSLALVILLCCFFRIQSKKGGEQRGQVIPIRVNGVNSSSIMSDSISSSHLSSPDKPHWWSHDRQLIPSSSGVTKFSYKELQKATHNFTALLGQGSFGPVYKATMKPLGTNLAVKVLAKHSKQGDAEFQTEVMLLGRLHHRNLVNLVGYCEERGQRILVYEFMTNGSLEQQLNDKEHKPLSWDQRVRIAQDISRGIEYLHDGAVPPVIHRDIKSANILLDSTMAARVADFGLSKEADMDVPLSGVKGTFGYVDPDYIATNRFTEKSDVYSFGVLLFELITARHPQQGLMEYVHLAALGVEGKEGWAELLDSRLDGNCDPEDLGAMAAIAYQCVNDQPRKRPKMSLVAQTLLTLGRRQYSHLSTMPSIAESGISVRKEFHLGERSKKQSSTRGIGNINGSVEMV